MRPIKLKGKDIKSGDWVEGDLLHGVGWKKDQVSILPFKQNLAYVKNCDPLDGVIIDPETLCQFTGLTDCNEKEIWEGDVCSGSTYDGVPIFGFVCFGNGCFFIKDDGICFYRLMDYTIAVIGNIHDNPELLKEVRS